MDFTGGKNSLGMVQNPPTNVGQAVSGNVCFVALSNGACMMILTKTVSQCQCSMVEEINPLNSCFLAESAQIADTEGVVVVNMTSPKTASVSKFIPCRYSAALIQSF